MISNFDEITTRTFELGSIVATRAAAESIPRSEMIEALKRHASGDWGEVCEEDKGLNDQALQTQGRLLSVYHTEDGTKFWIITEWDRSATTVLLPDDY